jgi:hypothetical protein
MFHTFHRDVILAPRTSGISQNLAASDDLFSKKSTSSISFVNPVQYYLSLTPQQDMEGRNERRN